MYECTRFILFILFLVQFYLVSKAVTISQSCRMNNLGKILRGYTRLRFKIVKELGIYLFISVYYAIFRSYIYLEPTLESFKLIMTKMQYKIPNKFLSIKSITRDTDLYEIYSLKLNSY